MHPDANNIYRCALSKHMPTNGFEFVLARSQLPRRSIPTDAHNDYAFAPETIKLNKVRKMVPILKDKGIYLIHSAHLKQYVELGGLKLRKVHRSTRFNQLP